MNAAMRKWIEEADYESLLQRWRWAPAGSPWFAGEIGDYYAMVLKQRRRTVGMREHVRASKYIEQEEDDA